MAKALRQAWWAPVAGLLGLGLLVLAVAVLFSDEDTAAIVASVVIALVGAAVLAAGLVIRPGRHALGSVLVALGALFGVFWFWTLVLPILGIIVLIGLVVTEVRTRPARPAT